MKGFTICPNCGGNGFTKHVFEAEETELQCKACSSQGEIPKDKFVHQTYKEKDRQNNWSTTNYVGPLLDANLFHNLKIVVD